MNRSALPLLCIAVLWLVACSDVGDSQGQGQGQAQTQAQGHAQAPGPDLDFLAPLEGEWVGVLSETPALQQKVIRETPMRLTIAAGGATRVEYPILECEGSLHGALPDSPQTEGDVGRFQLEVAVRRLSPCMSGPVRLTRKDDAIEYVYLGDTLRRVRAELHRRP